MGAIPKRDEGNRGGSQKHAAAKPIWEALSEKEEAGPEVIMKISWRVVALAMIGCAPVIMDGAPDAVVRAWPKEPDSFMGMKFGSSMSEVRQKLQSPNCSEGDEGSCDAYVPLADLSMFCVLSFPSDRFASILCSFPNIRFDDIKSTFIERYGPVHHQRIDFAQTLAGAKLRNPTLQWQGKRVLIEMMQYGADVEKGSLSVCLNSYMNSVVRNSREKMKKAAKGL